jgi:hypothetical protein
VFSAWHRKLDPLLDFYLRHIIHMFAPIDYSTVATLEPLFSITLLLASKPIVLRVTSSQHG